MRLSILVCILLSAVPPISASVPSLPRIPFQLSKRNKIESKNGKYKSIDDISNIADTNDRKASSFRGGASTLTPSLSNKTMTAAQMKLFK